MSNTDQKEYKRVDEATGFVSAYAEIAGCTVYALSNDTGKMANFMFMMNAPIPLEDKDGNITQQIYEKKKVASITMPYNQAKAFYESLKHHFEGQ